MKPIGNLQSWVKRDPTRRNVSVQGATVHKGPHKWEITLTDGPTVLRARGATLMAALDDLEMRLDW